MPASSQSTGTNRLQRTIAPASGGTLSWCAWVKLQGYDKTAFGSLMAIDNNSAGAYKGLFCQQDADGAGTADDFNCGWFAASGGAETSSSILTSTGTWTFLACTLNNNTLKWYTGGLTGALTLLATQTTNFNPNVLVRSWLASDVLSENAFAAYHSLTLWIGSELSSTQLTAERDRRSRRPAATTNLDSFLPMLTGTAPENSALGLTNHTRSGTFTTDGIATDASTSAVDATAAPTVDIRSASSDGVNRALFFATTAFGITSGVTTCKVTISGTDYNATKITNTTSSLASVADVEWWWLNDAALPSSAQTAAPITVTVDGGTLAVTPVYLEGVSQSAPTNFASNTGTGTSITSNFASNTQDDSILLACLFDLTTTDSPTVGSGQVALTSVNGTSTGNTHKHHTSIKYTTSAAADSVSYSDLTNTTGKILLGIEVQKPSAAAVLTASQASFTLTGNSAGLVHARPSLTAAQATFTLTGNATSFVRSRPPLTAAQASFTLTGNSATLTGPSGHSPLAADQASFSLTLNSASLRVSRQLAAEFGGFSAPASSAGLAAGRSVAAAQASFSLSGQAASLLPGHTLVAVQASFALTFPAVTLTRGMSPLTAAQGSLSLTGQAVTLRRGLSMAATTYVIAVSMFSAVLNASNGSVEGSGGGGGRGRSGQRSRQRPGFAS